MSRKGKGQLIMEGTKKHISGSYEEQMAEFNRGFQFIINKYGSKKNPDDRVETITKKIKTLFYKVFDAHVRNVYRPIITYNPETKDISFKVELKVKK